MYWQWLHNDSKQCMSADYENISNSSVPEMEDIRCQAEWLQWGMLYCILQIITAFYFHIKIYLSKYAYIFFSGRFAVLRVVNQTLACKWEIVFLFKISRKQFNWFSMAAAGAVFYNKIHLKKVFSFTTRDTSGQWGDPSLISISIDCAAIHLQWRKMCT